MQGADAFVGAHARCARGTDDVHLGRWNMGWSLGYLRPEEPELLDRFLLAVGKSLYLATAFEEKCKWVLRVAKIATARKEHSDASAAMVLAKAIRDKFLGPTITDMRAFFQTEDIVVLERAKDARNFIAHESANIGPLHYASAPHIRQRLALLRTELEALAAGDNLVSAWVYEVEEKEPAPRDIRGAYPDWIKNWVFGGVDCVDLRVKTRRPIPKGMAGLKEKYQKAVE